MGISASAYPLSCTNTVAIFFSGHLRHPKSHSEDSLIAEPPSFGHNHQSCCLQNGRRANNKKKKQKGRSTLFFFLYSYGGYNLLHLKHHSFKQPDTSKRESKKGCQTQRWFLQLHHFRLLSPTVHFIHRFFCNGPLTQKVLLNRGKKERSPYPRLSKSGMTELLEPP